MVVIILMAVVHLVKVAVLLVTELVTEVVTYVTVVNLVI